MKQIKLSFAGSVLLAALVFFGGAKDAKAEGELNIENHVDATEITFTAVHYDDVNVSDAYDVWDVIWTSNQGLYSDITTHKLSSDYRLSSSTKPFDINLVYNGTLGAVTENYLTFSLPLSPVWEFGTKPILFQADRLLYGPVVDVRRAIGENVGVVPLQDMAAGSYAASTPYGSGTLDIGTRLLADLDDGKDVSLADYCDLAKDWGKGPAQYVGDISGPNGIPDGYVNEYDLSAFKDDYLKSL